MLNGKSDLFRLVYRSRSAVDGSAREMQAAIDAIIEFSGRRNVDAQVTGALMHTHGFFVQALEGPAAAVEAAFDRICCDMRHRDLEVIECSPIFERSFGDWSMHHLVPDTSAREELDSADDVRLLSETAIRAMRLMVALTQSMPLSTKAAGTGSA